MIGPARRALAVALLASASAVASEPAATTPEARAVRFLSGQMARWSRENACFSCHHNGEPARAILIAGRAGIAAPEDAAAIDRTIAWISRPEGWDLNGGDGPFNDRVLARIVFASALDTLTATRRAPDRSAMIAAASRVAADQAGDGSWKLQGEDGLGSPASYGRSLATLTARDLLRAADPGRFRAAISKADAWLMAREPRGVFEAAVSLRATANAGADPERVGLIRRRALDLIRRGRNDDGGWGPYVNSPPEVFDTACVILALRAARPAGEDVTRMIREGRAYLIANQEPDGSWTETTRPSDSESEAQHLSTTAWALLALLETR